MNTPRTVILQLASAIAIAGEVLRAGALVEVTEAEAKDLLQRGKAVIAREAPAESDTADATIDEAERTAAEQAERAEREAAEEAARVTEEQAEAERIAAEQAAAAAAAGESSQGTQTPPQTEAKAEQPARRRNAAK